jgi:hypothetical protein
MDHKGLKGDKQQAVKGKPGKPKFTLSMGLIFVDLL